MPLDIEVDYSFKNSTRLWQAIDVSDANKTDTLGLLLRHRGAVGQIMGRRLGLLVRIEGSAGCMTALRL